MGMLSARIDLQLAELVAPQDVFRQHAAYRPLHESRGHALAHLTGSLLLQRTWLTTVAIVDLLVFLAPGLPTAPLKIC